MDESVLFKVGVALCAALASLAYAFITYRFVLRRSYEGIHSAYLIRKMFPVLIATFAATLTLTTFLWTRDRERDFRSIRQPLLSVEALDKRLMLLEKEVAVISASSSHDTCGSQIQESSLTLLQLRDAVTKNEEAIGRFEQLFLTDAERLITLPILHRDISAIRDDLSTTKESIAGLNRLIAESNGQNRWVIGTLALGMLALVVPAIRSLFPSAGKGDKKEKDAG